MKQIKELLAICEGATQDQWNCAHNSNDDDDPYTHRIVDNEGWEFIQANQDDAHYIATFSPTTVKALLLRLEKAEAREKVFKDGLLEIGGKFIHMSCLGGVASGMANETLYKANEQQEEVEG